MTEYTKHVNFDSDSKPIKHSPCPHCKAVGYLNYHGYLSGYEEGSSKRVKRAQRIYCSNRGRKRGCGKTYSIFPGTVIKGYMVTTDILNRFLVML